MKNDLKILKKMKEINQKTECYINQVKAFNPDASTDRLIENIIDTAKEVDKLHKERFNTVEKTVIIFADGKQMTFDGRITPEEIVGFNLEEEIVEVVDNFVVHTYTAKDIKNGSFGKILSIKKRV